MPVEVDERLCKGCNICVYRCPVDVLELSERRNEKGYNVAEVKSPDDCIHCRVCEKNCPDFAITVS